jgi:hypothetical protein
MRPWSHPRLCCELLLKLVDAENRAANAHAEDGNRDDENRQLRPERQGFKE